MNATTSEVLRMVSMHRIKTGADGCIPAAVSVPAQVFRCVNANYGEWVEASVVGYCPSRNEWRVLLKSPSEPASECFTHRYGICRCYIYILPLSAKNLALVTAACIFTFMLRMHIPPPLALPMLFISNEKFCPTWCVHYVHNCVCSWSLIILFFK
jgi:hypothetical protein